METGAYSARDESSHATRMRYDRGVVDEVGSEAVVLFLGRGSSSFPTRCPEQLVARFGEERAEELRRYVEGLLGEASSRSVDWTQRSLAIATAEYEAEVRSGHPELSDEAVAALGWEFSYAWK